MGQQIHLQYQFGDELLALGVTNLSELNEPLFRLIKEVSETGKETAKIMYGADGWVLHHNTDIWRVTGAIDKAPSGMWPSGGAWALPSFMGALSLHGRCRFPAFRLSHTKRTGRFFDEIMDQRACTRLAGSLSKQFTGECTFRQ